MIERTRRLRNLPPVREANEGGEGPMFSVELRSDAQERMNETTLAGAAKKS